MNCKLDSDSFCWLVGGKENISVISGIIGEADVHNILSGSLWWEAQLPAFSGSTLVTHKNIFVSSKWRRYFFLLRFLLCTYISHFRPYICFLQWGRPKKQKGDNISPPSPFLVTWTSEEGEGGCCLQKKSAQSSPSRPNIWRQNVLFSFKYMPLHKYTVAL